MKQAEKPRQPNERVKELTAKIAALRTSDNELLAEQLALEAAGAVPEEPPLRNTIESRRAFWLTGAASLASTASPSQRLHAVILDRAAIAAAIETLEHQLFEAKADDFRQFLQTREREWRAICHRRCLALLELRAANNEAEAFRRTAASIAPGPLSLPCDRISGPFGRPVIGDSVYRFLEDCIKAGIIQRREIEP